MKIHCNQTFEAHNLLSCRGIYLQTEVNALISRMRNYIVSHGAKQVGSLINASFSLVTSESQSKVDLEIMIPLDKMIDPSDVFAVKPIFRLTNALKIRHEGNPIGLQETANQLNSYIIFNNLELASTCYKVTIKEAETLKGLDSMIIDLYVSIQDGKNRFVTSFNLWNLVFDVTILQNKWKRLGLHNKKGVSMRYVIIKQFDENDCGAACIATISKQYGLHTSIAKIREIAGTDIRGTNILGMVKAAEEIGFSAKGVKGTQANFVTDFPLPAIAHVISNGRYHFVVVHKKQKSMF